MNEAISKKILLVRLHDVHGILCSDDYTTRSSVVISESIDRDWKVYAAKCMCIPMILNMATGNKW